MIKLTLDTNCIINLLDYKSESATSVDELAEILRYALDEDANIAITTRVESDVTKDKDKKQNLENYIISYTQMGYLEPPHNMVSLGVLIYLCHESLSFLAQSLTKKRKCS